MIGMNYSIFFYYIITRNKKKMKKKERGTQELNYFYIRVKLNYAFVIFPSIKCNKDMAF